MKKILNFINNYPHRKILLMIIIFFIGYLLTMGYLIYTITLWHTVETLIRYALIMCLVIVGFIFLLSGVNIIIRPKKISLVIYLIITTLFGFVQLGGAYYIDKAYSSINKINKTEVTYSTSLISLRASKIKKISDVKNIKIGIINDKKDIEGYVIGQDIIKENNLKSDNQFASYDNSLSMLNDLYNKKIDAIFVSSNYPALFSSIDEYQNIKNETNIIITKTKTETKKEETYSNSTSLITKPFTILLMGVDSDVNGIKSGSFNGDSLLLVTFNPITLNTTMLSIPRDTYVPVACFPNQKKSKITHAAWQGSSCMIKTIQNLTGIKIDYYIKINFKGVVDLVNTLGGVYVDVPYSLCEQNSNRQWGKNTVYVKAGYHKLNGEQALAFARNRHSPNDGTDVGNIMHSYCPAYNKGKRDDFERGKHQQQVVNAIFNKMKDVRDINQMYNILDLVQQNMDTNLSTNQILSFYNLGKIILNSSKTTSDILDSQRLYLSTWGPYPYPVDEGAIQVYYEGSLKDIVKAMKVNLGLIKPTITKDFSFSINEPYEPETIGRGSYTKTLLEMVPNFTQHTRDWAISWGINNNIPIKFITTDSSNINYIQDQIINQSIRANSIAENVNNNTGITLTIVNKISSKTNCTLEENEDNNVCYFPTKVGDNISAITSWQNKVTLGSVIITKKATATNDESKDGIIIDQDDVEKGDKVADLPFEIVINYYKYEE